MPDLSQPRELGSDLSEITCEACGTRRELAESPYGSLSPEPCPKCATAPEKAIEVVKPNPPAKPAKLEPVDEFDE